LGELVEYIKKRLCDEKAKKRVNGLRVDQGTKRGEKQKV